MLDSIFYKTPFIIHMRRKLNDLSDPKPILKFENVSEVYYMNEEKKNSMLGQNMSFRLT